MKLTDLLSNNINHQKFLLKKNTNLDFSWFIFLMFGMWVHNGFEKEKVSVSSITNTQYGAGSRT